MTEGLTLTAKKFMKFFQPLSSETVVSSVSSLLYRYATPHNATGHGREEGGRTRSSHSINNAIEGL